MTADQTKTPDNGITDSAPATATPVDTTIATVEVATSAAAAATVAGAVSPPTATPDPNPTPTPPEAPVPPPPARGARPVRRDAEHMLRKPTFWLAVVAVGLVVYFAVR